MGLSEEAVSFCWVGASWDGFGWIVFNGCIMGGLLGFTS